MSQTSPPRPPSRRRRNSSRVNLVISAVFHTAVILALFYFAAREGMLGKKMKTLAAVMVREKPPEKPKEKPPEPKVEPPKEPPKVAAATPKAAVPAPVTTAAPPPPVASAPAAAPPAAALAAFDFSDGAKAVITTTNVVELYKGQIEYAFRSRWVRPEGMEDEAYVAEVQVEIDPGGKVLSTEWKRGSGNAKWDDSVKKAVGQTRTISRPPPKDFPTRFVVRFDVQAEADGISQGGTIQ